MQLIEASAFSTHHTNLIRVANNTDTDNMPVVPNNGKPLVLLTGVSGFCGAWIAHALLHDGYAVCGVVRSKTKGEHLASLFSSSGHGSSFFFEKVEDTAKV